MPLRSRGYLIVLVAALAITPQETAAVDLEHTTVAAYDRYIETVAQAFSKQVGTDAFLAQVSPQALDRLRHGEILLEPGSGDGIIDVPEGLIHHWRGTAFVPNVTLEEVLRVARDYTRYTAIYDWVVAADLVASEGNRYRTFFRARRRAGAVTGVVDVWMVTEYQHLRPGRATSVARADCVRQGNMPASLQNIAFGQVQAMAISGALTRCRNISNGTAASTWSSTRSVSVAASQCSWDGSSSRSHGGSDAPAQASH